MVVINPQLLEPGDIILTRSSSRESQLIRQRSKSEYSHAILYVGDYSCIESDGLGVQAQNIQRLFFEDNNSAIVLRLKDSDSKILLNNGIDFARHKIGTEYSTSEAKFSANNTDNTAREGNRQFCTRLIAQAYDYAGIRLVNNPDYCSPQEVLLSNLLVTVEGILRNATQQEIDFFTADEDNPLERQKEIHNSIFELSRNLSGEDIQNFEQLFIYILDNPSKEAEITAIVSDSGYLEMWKMDVSLNPWYYDYKVMLDNITDPNERKKLGEIFTSNEKDTRKRFYMMLEILEDCYSVNKQKFFKIMINLYTKLIELSEQREAVGKLALKGWYL